MTEIEKKKWKVRTTDQAKEITFFPTFEINQVPGGPDVVDPGTKEVECRYVDIEVLDDSGKTVKLRMNYMDLFLFVYQCANEELRQQLQMRYERQSGQIPYEVTFSISQEEKDKGVAKRLITLTVDEITMAIARSQANVLLGKAKLENLETYIARKKQESARNKLR